MAFSLQNKYKQLVAVLILTLILPAFLPQKLDALSLSFCTFLSILIFLREFCLNDQVFRFYALFAAIGFACDGSHLLLATGWYAWISAVMADSIYSIFLLVAALLIGREIFIGKKVTNDTIFGGVCLYFILGIFWYLLYDNLFLLQQKAFRCEQQHIVSFDLLYFSFATLTTVGYGDIIPMIQPAKMAASLQGIVGILFPSVFMARLIGLYKTEEPTNIATREASCYSK